MEYHKTQEPRILSLEYSNPLNIRYDPRGSLKALVIATVICGGEVDLSKGIAKLPGLVEVVERLTLLVKKVSEQPECGYDAIAKEFLSNQQLCEIDSKTFLLEKKDNV